MNRFERASCCLDNAKDSTDLTFFHQLQLIQGPACVHHLYKAARVCPRLSFLTYHLTYFPPNIHGASAYGIKSRPFAKIRYCLQSLHVKPSPAVRGLKVATAMKLPCINVRHLIARLTQSYRGTICWCTTQTCTTRSLNNDVYMESKDRLRYPEVFT